MDLLIERAQLFVGWCAATHARDRDFPDRGSQGLGAFSDSGRFAGLFLSETQK
jgi:hypothetical protein